MWRWRLNSTHDITLGQPWDDGSVTPQKALSVATAWCNIPNRDLVKWSMKSSVYWTQWILCMVRKLLLPPKAIPIQRKTANKHRDSFRHQICLFIVREKCKCWLFGLFFYLFQEMRYSTALPSQFTDFPVCSATDHTRDPYICTLLSSHTATYAYLT